MPILLASLLVIAGCGSWFKKKKMSASAPVFTAKDDFDSPQVRAKFPSLSETYRQTPLVAPPAPSLPVVRGVLPLVYIVSSPATVRIVDETDKTTIATQSVIANTTIAVDAARGVSIGGQRITRDALSADHPFSIYLDTEAGPSVFRNGVIRPGKPAVPTTMGVER